MKRITLATLALLFPLALGQANPEARPAVRLGVNLHSTGAQAVYGWSEAAAVRLAFATLGRSNATPVDPLYANGGSQAGWSAVGVANLNRAGVIGVVGPSGSDAALASGDLFEAFRLPALALDAGAEGVVEQGEFIGRASVSAKVFAQATAEAAGRRVRGSGVPLVLFDAADRDSFDEASAFALGLHAAGYVQVDMANFQSQRTVPQLVQNRPLITVSAALSTGARIIREVRAAGYGGALLGGNAFATPSLGYGCGPACDGLLVGAAFDPATGGEPAQVLRAYYQQAAGRLPSGREAQAFTAVQAFIYAVRRVEKRLNDPQSPGLTTAQRDLIVQAAARLGHPARLTDLPMAAQRDLIRVALFGPGNAFLSPLGPVHFDAQGNLLQQRASLLARVRVDEQRRSTLTYLRK